MNNTVTITVPAGLEAVGFLFTAMGIVGLVIMVTCRPDPKSRDDVSLFLVPFAVFASFLLGATAFILGGGF